MAVWWKMEKGQVKHLPIGKNYRDELLELINGRKYNGLFHEHKAAQLVESIALHWYAMR